MQFLPTSQRRVIAELMDAPNLDAASHRRALAGLRRINTISRTAASVIGPILRLARRRQIRRVSLLDIACGSGDVPVAIAARAQARGLILDLTLFDRSPTALAQAQAAAAATGLHITTRQGAAPDGLPDGPFDIITSCLFLHHLSAGDTIRLLAAMRQRAARLVVISDLQRSLAGLAAAWLGCRVLSRSPIVHYDGPASVRAAWTRAELAGLAAEAGMPRARIDRAWPFRMLLTWEASP